MSKWFEQMMEKNAIISGQALMEKAEMFAVQLEIPDFKPNQGWLQRWKKHENILFKKLHGESSSADKEASDRFKENILPSILQNYTLDNIYNADETGLMYKAIPGGTFAPRDKAVTSGFKLRKDRIKLLFICNATGSDKHVFSIGKYKQPRCFRGKNLPIAYRFNPKAWMTSTIWCEVIKELDENIGKKNKKILLLIDNASCHKLDFNPQNIEIVFFTAMHYKPHTAIGPRHHPLF